jgi:hypothetical protein
MKMWTKRERMRRTTDERRGRSGEAGGKNWEEIRRAASFW